MRKKCYGLMMLFAAVILVMASCSHKSNDVQPANPGTGTGSGGGGGTGGGTGGDTGGGANPPDTALCFERDILPIFKSSCAMSGCHDKATKANDEFEFTSYETITRKEFSPGNPGRTELYEKITEEDDDDRMPQPPFPRLTDDQIGKIYRWIKMGAPNSKCSSGGCDSTRFTFAATVQPILTTNCRGCHNSTSAPSGVNLEAYAGVKAAVDNGRLLGAINHQPGFSPMPKNGSKLNSCQILQISKWISAGAQNN